MKFTTLAKSAVSFIAILALGLSLSSGVVSAQENQPAIEVNGEVVEKSEIQDRINQTVQRMKNQYGDQIKGDKAEARLEKQAKKRIIEQTVQHLVLKTHAEQSNVSVTEQQVQKRVQSTIERFPSEEAFQKALQKEGMTRSDFEGQIREGLLVDQFLQKQIDDVEISNAEARQYYDQNSERFQDRSFDQVKEKVRSTLKQMKQRKAQQKVISDLREKSEVEIRI